MDKPKLFLHIGLHKTGSTTLQHVLRSNGPALWEENLLYIPKIPVSKTIRLLERDDPEVVKEGRVYLNQYWQKYASEKGLSFLISNESLCGNPMSGYDNTLLVSRTLRQITADVETCIIVYIRGDFFSLD